MIVRNRIKKHSEFQEVIAKGKLERSQCFNMYFIKNTLNEARIGISVPKKSGNAVVRNKIKRQVRAMCGELMNFSLNYDLVLVIRKDYNIQNFSLIKDELENLLKKLG